MVEGAPCELEPPTLDWINVSVQAKPNGARYMPSQDVRVKEKTTWVSTVCVFTSVGMITVEALVGALGQIL
jgi:hypothetical protein